MLASIAFGDWLIWFGAAVAVGFSVPYVLAVARGQLLPSRVTWSVWCSTTLIALAASWEAGAVAALVVPGGAFLRAVAVLVASFVPTLRGISTTDPLVSAAQRRVDVGCLAACAGVLVVRYFSGDPLLALALIIVVDGIAAVPTIIRAAQGRERAGPFASAGFGAVCVLLVLDTWTFADWAFPLWELTLMTVISVLVWMHQPMHRHGQRARLGRARPALVVGGGAAVIGTAVALVAGAIPRPDVRADALPAPPTAIVIAQADPALIPVASPVLTSTAIPSVRTSVQVPDQPGYVTIRGNQAWVTHRVNSAMPNAGLITVLDLSSDQVVATTPVAAGPARFLTFCGPNREWAYVSVYDDAASGHGHGHVGEPRALIAVLDVATLQQVETIPVGRRPYASACSADGRTLVVPSHDDARLDSIDTTTQQVRTRVANDPVTGVVGVPPNPHAVAVDAEGRWWTANHESNLVSIYPPDLAGHEEIPLLLDNAEPGISPHFLAVSPDGDQVAVAAFDSAQMWLIAVDGTVQSVTSVGRGSQAVAWTADGARVLSANVYGGTVTVIAADTARVTASIPVASPTSIATTPDGRSAYVTSLDGDSVMVLDVASVVER